MMTAPATAGACTLRRSASAGSSEAVQSLLQAAQVAWQKLALAQSGSCRPERRQPSAGADAAGVRGDDVASGCAPRSGFPGSLRYLKASISAGGGAAWAGSQERRGLIPVALPVRRVHHFAAAKRKRPPVYGSHQGERCLRAKCA